jgi:hypothetical protein
LLGLRPVFNHILGFSRQKGNKPILKHFQSYFLGFLVTTAMICFLGGNLNLFVTNFWHVFFARSCCQETPKKRKEWLKERGDLSKVKPIPVPRVDKY